MPFPDHSHRTLADTFSLKGRVAVVTGGASGVWWDETSGAFEAIAHFETKDSRAVAIPAISSMRLKDGFIQRFLFVMDAAPVFS